MTRSEFLSKLREVLSGEMDEYTIQNHLNYYDAYITDEINKGQTEKEVLEELGDPWIIAKSLAEAPDASYGGQVFESYSDTAYDDSSSSYGNSYGDSYGNSYKGSGTDNGVSHRRIQIIGSHAWWKTLLVIAGVIGVAGLLFAIISGIISFIAPVAVPFLVIMLVVRFFRNRN